MENNSTPKSGQFVKAIGPVGATLLIIGAIIGTGIFRTPTGVFQSLPNYSLVLIAWVIGGLIALTGALGYAELGALMPKAGGQYNYLRKAYGPQVSFLLVWEQSLIGAPGSVATLMIVFCDYAGYFVEMSPWTSKMVAITILLIITYINYRGVKTSGIVLSLLTIIKVVAIVGLILLGLSLGTQTPDFTHVNFNTDFSFKALGIALVSVMWAYGGWQHLSFPSEEVKNPLKTIPFATIAGVLFVTLAYILINLSFMKTLPMNELGTNKQIAASAIESVVGLNGARIMAIIVMLSALGTATIYTLTTPRMLYALSRDGNFIPSFGKLHEKYGTPHRSLILKTAMAIIILLVSKDFMQVMEYAAFAGWFFQGLTILGIIILRKKMPGERTFKIPGYPVLPVIFFLFMTFIFFQILADMELEQVVTGLGIIFLGLPAYYFFKKRNETPSNI